MSYRLECQFGKKLNIKCREFQLILQMIVVEINLTITMTYLQSNTRIMQYRNLSKQIFDTIIGIAKRQPLCAICWMAQSSRPRCRPRHPILHANIFFNAKLFAIIILSCNLLKYIFWYLLELSDLLFKNVNSVLPIFIEINFE